MKKAKAITGILFLIVVIAAVIVLSGSVVVTNENQYGVIMRFGKIERIIKEAGLSIKTPFIETVNFIPKSIQFYDMPESDVITKDKKTMVADDYVLWKVDNPTAFVQNLGLNLGSAQSRIDAQVYNGIKTVISSKDQTEVISGRDGALDTAIMESIGDSLKQYGINIISVETKRIDLPSDNKTAVFARMISEREQIAANFTAEGEATAQKIRNETDKEVAISISDAQAQAATIMAEGEAEYMRILAAAYSDASRSDFYTFIRSLEAAKTSLQGTDKTLILSADSPIAKIFNSIQ